MTDGEPNRDDNRSRRRSADHSRRRSADRSSRPHPVSDGGRSWRDLFDAFPDPVVYFEVEQDTRVVRGVNPAFEGVFDVEESAVTGDRLADHLLVGTAEGESEPRWERTDSVDDSEDPDTDANAEEILSRLVAGERVAVGFRPEETEDWHYFRLEAVPSSDDDTEGYIVYTTVTDLHQQMDHHRRRANRLERVASVTAHDLRNPLDVAKIRLEAARDTGENVHFEKVEEALGRIQRIIQNVLSVGGGAIDPSETVLLDDIAESAWATVETADATLVLEDNLPTIRADADRLQQIFENLFRNAVEHGSTSPRSQTHEDAVEHGSTNSRPSDDDTVEHGGVEHGGADVLVTVGGLEDGFYVADDGSGIPPAERERAFDPGYSTAESNTGLGLAIVQQIAADHGWEVTITDSDDGGARFTFSGVEIE